tara:strand:- start:1817 stop:2620 length:804 start_codon:yes stop_codon:yes gene_type:complete
VSKFPTFLQYIAERQYQPIDREDVIDIVDDEIDEIRTKIEMLEGGLSDDMDQEIQDQVKEELKGLMDQEVKTQLRHYMKEILPELVSAGEIDYKPSDTAVGDDASGDVTGQENWTAGITAGGYINVIDATTGQTVARFAPRGPLVTDPNVSGNLITFTIKDEDGSRIGQVHELPSGRLVQSFRAGKPGDEGAIPELRFRPGERWAGAAEEMGFTRKKTDDPQSLAAKSAGVRSTLGGTPYKHALDRDWGSIEDIGVDLSSKDIADKS